MQICTDVKLDQRFILLIENHDIWIMYPCNGKCILYIFVRGTQCLHFSMNFHKFDGHSVHFSIFPHFPHKSTRVHLLIKHSPRPVFPSPRRHHLVLSALRRTGISNSIAADVWNKEMENVARENSKETIFAKAARAQRGSEALAFSR